MAARFLILTISLFLNLALIAQNEFEIGSIRSPQFEENYELTDSVNVEVTLLNKGPNVILGTDYIYFDVKVSNPDTTIFYNMRRLSLTGIPINGAEIFTLINDLKFDSQANYQVCVNVSGTDQYPTNVSKKPGPCLPFVVGVEEVKIQASKIRFQENLIRFELNQTFPNTIYRILDLSGKVLNSGDISQARVQELRFRAPARGLYFLQLQSAKGQQSTFKFIVR